MRMHLGLALLSLTLMAATCGEDETGADGSGDGNDKGGSASGADGDGGGAGSSGGVGKVGKVSSGVDQDMAATELSVDDAQTVCEAFESSMSDEAQLEADCTSSAAQETDSQAACEEWRDNCIARKDNQDGGSDSCDGEEILAGLMSCDEGTTVGDIESCLNEMFAWEASLTCADAGTELTPPSCFEGLLTACPMLFDGDDGGDGDGDGNGTGNGDGDPNSPDNGGNNEGVDLRTCQDNEAAAESLDCEAFCGALDAAGCDQGPTPEECNQLCGEMLNVCPGIIGELAACQQADEPTWVCDEDGDPDLTGCGMELACFGGCLDSILAQ